MPSIGGISCDYLHVESIRYPKERVIVWQTPGIDGFGAQTIGKGDSDFAFVAVGYGLEADAETWMANIEALQGTVVTAVDDWNRTHNNLLVMSIGSPKKTPRVNLDNVGNCRVEIRIEGLVLKKD